MSALVALLSQHDSVLLLLPDLFMRALAFLGARNLSCVAALVSRGWCEACADDVLWRAAWGRVGRGAANRRTRVARPLPQVCFSA
jgi:hypothetical protein